MLELFDQQLADSSKAFASLSRSGVSHGSALTAKSVRSGAKTDGNSAGEWEMHSFGAKMARNSAKWRENTRFGAKTSGNSAGRGENGRFGAKTGGNGAVVPRRENVIIRKIFLTFGGFFKEKEFWPQEFNNQ